MAGKSNKGTMRLLDLRGQTWWLKIDIPKECRHHFGKTAYLQSLETGDIKTAMARRDQVEPGVRALFAGIKAGTIPSAATLAARDRGALWRETLTDLKEDPSGHEADEGEWSQFDLAMTAAEEVAERYRGKDRKEFDDAFTGKVPVDEHLEAYLKAIKLAEKTTNERRGLVKRLARWCETERLKLSDINRRAAGRYVTAVIEPMDRRTAKKHMTALRGYWDYLTMRGHVEGKIFEGKAVDSPWLGQTMPESKRRAERGDRDDEREFTEAETRTLLYADWPEGMDPEHRQQIEDALRISLLSGMRMAEVLTLRVEEVHDDVFDIRQGKTNSAVRKVPVHPDLKEIVKRRTERKGPKEWLFHELANERDPGDTFGKRFNRYRKHLEVDDVRPGKRRSLVNFHSARRWFIVQARYAGHSVETIKDVVGHAPDKKDITFGVYTKGASDKQMRDCVEAVKLPDRPQIKSEAA
jgi:integrase